MKTEFSCIIIDDEDYAVGLLESSVLELYSNISVAGCYYTWRDALEAVRNTSVDLIFLDVSIEGRSGLDILKVVPGIQAEVIFVTAYSEYALDAFQTIASGYLVKPFSDAELCNTINRALDRIRNKRFASSLTAASQPSAKVAIRNGYGVSYFDTADIIYLEAMKDCTRVVTRTGEVKSPANLGKYSHILEDKTFFKVHRSYIVNVNAIVRYESYGVVILSDKSELPVARNLRDALLAAMSS